MRLPATRLKRIGIQLYTIRDQFKADPAATLAALAAMGYREVEFAGLQGHEARALRALLDANRISAPSGHFGVPELTTDFEQTARDAKILGHDYLVLADVPEEYRTAEGYERAAVLMNEIAERCRNAGFRFGYHNHDFEFRPLEERNGLCGYDLILTGTAKAKVVMELDLYWIRNGGRDALGFFARWPSRFRMVHVKDMDVDGAMVDVGAGAMDWRELLGTARKIGVEHFFVEHDETKDPMQFARTSYDYLSRLSI